MKTMMLSKHRNKIIILMLLTLLLVTVIYQKPVFATSVASAVEDTWKDARTQIKTICNNVVFPVISLVLAVLFFVKLMTNYFDYKKHGSFEFTAPAILFAGLILALSASKYVWVILGF